MQPVEFLYADSNFRRRSGSMQQELSFCLSVANLAFDKQVTVVLAGENDRWSELAARYLCPSGGGRELWRSLAVYDLTADSGLPGTIRFAVRLAAEGHEFWDNNGSRNYTAKAGCGIMLRNGLQLAHCDPGRLLGRMQAIYPVRAAVRMEAQPQQVFVRWTSNNWASCSTTPCCFKGRRGQKGRESRGLDTGPGIWTAHLPVQDAFRIEYALASLTRQGVIWDNNLGLNFHAVRPALKILTLNLHCYQEENQDEKFSRIAAAVNELDIDLVCLQEVGEHWNNGRGNWSSNAAKIINDRLRKPYHILTDWSHVGFDRYREGIAILSRYPFLTSDSGYVSASENANCINSRKVCMARLQVPALGIINLFCVHLSWWAGGFQEQLAALVAWADRRHDAATAATLLCGDFNVSPDSQGYGLAAQRYDDQVLAARGQEKAGQQTHEHSPAANERIDYIFMKKGSCLKAVKARALFTDADYGRVSDHCGYCAEFEPAGP